MVQRSNFFAGSLSQSWSMWCSTGIYHLPLKVRNLSVNQNLISRWARQFKQGEQHAFPTKIDDAQAYRLQRGK
jgi:hypothetical protein